MPEAATVGGTLRAALKRAAEHAAAASGVEWLALALRRPGVLVVNQPTWGVDAGAAALIRQELIDLSRQGSAVLVISQDLDEIFEIADRIAVISRGQMSDAEPAEAMTRERIGLLMGGMDEGQGGATHAA